MKVLSITVNNTKNYKPAFGDSPDMTPNEMGQRSWDETLKAEKRTEAERKARAKSLRIKTKRNANIREAQKELRASVQESLSALNLDEQSYPRAIKRFFKSLPYDGRAGKLKVGDLKKVVMNALKKMGVR